MAEGIETVGRRCSLGKESQCDKQTCSSCGWNILVQAQIKQRVQRYGMVKYPDGLWRVPEKWYAEKKDKRVLHRNGV